MSVDAEADAITARLRAPKPCAMARHPKFELITALLKRNIAYKAISREIKPYISNQGIRAHAIGDCTCQRT